MQKKLMVGEHPPRQTAPADEDPWNEGYLSRLIGPRRPELWRGAEKAMVAKGQANLNSATRSDLVGGPFG